MEVIAQISMCIQIALNWFEVRLELNLAQPRPIETETKEQELYMYIFMLYVCIL